VLIALLLAVPLGLVAMITPLTSILGVFTFFAIVAVVMAIVFAAYARQKPRDKQTSYHQPVRLVQVKRHSRRVSGLTLSFTHARYARLFANANAETVSRGVLEVQGG
jgi:hypothetical protein